MLGADERKTGKKDSGVGPSDSHHYMRSIFIEDVAQQTAAPGLLLAYRFHVQREPTDTFAAVGLPVITIVEHDHIADTG